MSYIIADLVNYANLQSGIETAFTFAPNPNTAQGVPMLTWLYSPANRGNLEMLVSPGKGKTRTVELNYMQEFADSSIETDVANPTCATGSVHPDNYQTYTIDTTDNVSKPFTITRADLETAFRDNENYVNEIILNLMYLIERGVATKTATEALTLAGNWHTDVSEAYTVSSDFLVLKTLKDSDPTIMQPFTMEDLTMALQMTGYAQPPVVFGGVKLTQYARRIIAGATGDFGVDLAKMVQLYGIGATYDHYMKSAFSNQTDAMAFHPGAAQLLTYVAAPWRDGMPYVTEGSNYTQVSLFSPRTGIPMDLLIKDDCGTVTFRVTATTKLVGLPTDYFNASNGFDGVTFVNKVRITNV